MNLIQFRLVFHLSMKYIIHRVCYIKGVGIDDHNWTCGSSWTTSTPPVLLTTVWLNYIHGFYICILQIWTSSSGDLAWQAVTVNKFRRIPRWDPFLRISEGQQSTTMVNTCWQGGDPPLSPIWRGADNGHTNYDHEAWPAGWAWTMTG